MSNRSRWQPPHPDPARLPATNPLNFVGPTPTHRESDKTCIFPGCPKRRGADLKTGVCMAHAVIIYRDVERVLGDELLQRSKEIDERERLLHLNTLQIEGGHDPVPGAPIPGWVYYVRVDDTIKIGYAKNVASRMRHYPPNAELLAVEPGTLKVEKQRHDHFNAYLAWGREWFRTSDELMTWITGLREKYNPRPFTYQYRQSGAKRIVGTRNYCGIKKTAA